MKDEQSFLRQYRQDDYPRPSVTADVVAFTLSSEVSDNYRRNAQPKLLLLLIKRGGHPFKGCWALPGGFLNPGETIEQCALREIEEETAVRPVFFCIGDELVRHIYQGRTFSFQIRRQQCQKVVSPALSVEQAEALPETPFINGDVGNQMAGRSHSGSGTGCKHKSNFLSRHFFPE